MAGTPRSDDSKAVVKFMTNDDGRITARDTETGVTSYGETRAEALKMLARAIELQGVGAEPIDEGAIYEMGLESADGGAEVLPEIIH